MICGMLSAQPPPIMNTTAPVCFSSCAASRTASSSSRPRLRISVDVGDVVLRIQRRAQHVHQVG